MASELQLLPIGPMGVADKQALLESLSQALGFPDWFGANWDALEDCLTDLSWRKEGGHLLLIEPMRLPADDLATFIDILAASASYWAERGERFFAVFADPDNVLALPELA